MKKNSEPKKNKELKTLPAIDGLEIQDLRKELTPLELIKREKDPEIDPLDLLNEKIDINMNTLIEKSVTTKVTDNTTFKNIVNSNITDSINRKLQPSIKNIFTIIGRIYLVIGIVFILYSLILFNKIDQMSTGWFRTGLYSLSFFVSSLLIFFMGIGILNQKKRIIGLTVIGLVISTISCIISLIPQGALAIPYESFGGNLFSVVITFILLILIFKNKEMFDK